MKRCNFPYVICNQIVSQILFLFFPFCASRKKIYYHTSFLCGIIDIVENKQSVMVCIYFVFLLSFLPLFSNLFKYETKMKIHLTCTQSFWSLFPKDCHTWNTHVKCCFLQGWIRQSSDCNILAEIIYSGIMQEKFELWVFLFQLEFRSNRISNIPIIYDHKLFLTKEN